MADEAAAGRPGSGRSRWLWWLGLLFLLGYITWILAPYLRSVIVRDAAVTARIHVATAPLRGTIHELAVSIGERIGADGLIATIRNPLADRSALAQAEARVALAEEVGRYAGSDLLCYLAEGPESLVALEQAAWDPWREWAALELELPLLCTAGITPLNQPAASLERAEQLALDLDDFSLTGLAYAAALFGSAVLAFAVQRGALPADEAFAAARIDEAFQEERWGVDAEAAARTAKNARDAAMIGRWFDGLRG